MKRPGEVRRTMRRLLKSPLTLIGITIILVLFVVAIFAPYIAPNGPTSINPSIRLQAPSRQHFLGTDNAGRDIFSRIVYGARISLRVGAVIVSTAVVIGLLIGVPSAYFGGVADELIMRSTDVFLSFPYLVFAMAITAALGRGITNAMLAMVVIWWPAYARLVRSQVLKVKEQQYIESARSIGVSTLRIIVRHVLPNSVSPIIVQGSLDFGQAIMMAAGLSFIGLGAQPPSPEWGAMATIGSRHMREAWWFATFPGLAILVSVMGFNLLGDGLRDFLDPRLRRLKI